MECHNSTVTIHKLAANTYYMAYKIAPTHPPTCMHSRRQWHLTVAAVAAVVLLLVVVAALLLS
jgi:hypothetical protein